VARAKLGDIVEIPTPSGLAYAQYTHKHSMYGALLRVFSGTHPTRPTDLNSVLAGDVQFMCFFPLQAAIEAGIVQVAGNASLPVGAAKLPVFRAGVMNPATRKVGVWWLWDGEREWRVGSLTPEERYYPIRGVWNDALLVERIVSGWRPENDPTTEPP
jgi:hypothetical protein